MTKEPKLFNELEPDWRPPFVDAHLHLWDRYRLRYPWLDDPSVKSISDDYLPVDYLAETAGWNLAGSVHADAGAHEDDGEAETAWLNTEAEAGGLPTGIIARVALEHPDVDRLLERQAACRRVKGIRHLINWHPSDLTRRVYPHDLTTSGAWQRGYTKLGAFGLSYDFHGFPPQLAGLARIAVRHPEVPVILNHLALPIPADGWEEWRAGIVAFAAMPHAAIKLSGAGFIEKPFNPATFRDVIWELIDRFGTDRVLVATNFPTDRMFASLSDTLTAYETILSGLSIDERRDVWVRNANRIYRLGLNI